MRILFSLSLALGLFLSACASNTPDTTTDSRDPNVESTLTHNAVAVFAGGCFWCTEAIYERVEGVSKVISGYSGGDASTANYKAVCSGTTDHTEAIEIYYDSTIVSYETLVTTFLKGGHDATQLNRQGPDVGTQYRSAIFFKTKAEQSAVIKLIAQIDKEGYYSSPIVTEVLRLVKFYPAEDYHQDYYEHNPNQSYVYNVSRPKLEKFIKLYPELLKMKYR